MTARTATSLPELSLKHLARLDVVVHVLRKAQTVDSRTFQKLPRR